MPNWCVGTLKVRGEKDNIRKFLTDGLAPLDSSRGIAIMLGKDPGPEPAVEIEEDKWEMKLKTKEGFHLKGTRRNFIDSKEITWEPDRDVLIIHNYQTAWAIDVEGLSNLSKEYQIDLKIYAFERGMEFNLDVEIHNGAIIKNDEITFNDYDWECIEPSLGG